MRLGLFKVFNSLNLNWIKQITLEAMNWSLFSLTCVWKDKNVLTFYCAPFSFHTRDRVNIPLSSAPVSVDDKLILKINQG